MAASSIPSTISTKYGLCRSRQNTPMMKLRFCTRLWATAIRPVVQLVDR
jgi:hypothetical protein